jgi:hypothetical protein
MPSNSGGGARHYDWRSAGSLEKLVGEPISDAPRRAGGGVAGMEIV